MPPEYSDSPTLINRAPTVNIDQYMHTAPSLLTAQEAADRLGVKPATLYAYVSRGLLVPERSPDGRSLFRPADLERLSQPSGLRRRPARRPALPAITTVEDQTLFYRGRDALELAGTATFEEVAVWLWLGRLEAPGDWSADAETVASGRAAQAALPARALPLDRLRVIVPAVAAVDDLRHDTTTEAVVIAGRRLLGAMVEGLPQRSGPNGASLAARLWAGLCARLPEPAELRLLDSALIVTADHELSTSTLAARLAASIQADPYAVVSVGLSALGGSLHSVASLAAEDLLADASGPRPAAEVIGERLRRGERLPGFGHRLHPDGDPRAKLLLHGLRTAYAGSDRLEAVAAVLAATGARALPAPNVDFALAALAQVAGMERGASEAVFAVARAAGWLAHAIEEYEAVGSGWRGRRAIYITTPSGPER
jgi:citrate synthase